MVLFITRKKARPNKTEQKIKTFRRYCHARTHTVRKFNFSQTARLTKRLYSPQVNRRMAKEALRTSHVNPVTFASVLASKLDRWIATVVAGVAVDGALRCNSPPEPAVTVWSEPVRKVRGLVRGCSHSDLPRLRGEPPTWLSIGGDITTRPRHARSVSKLRHTLRCDWPLPPVAVILGRHPQPTTNTGVKQARAHFSHSISLERFSHKFRALVKASPPQQPFKNFG